MIPGRAVCQQAARLEAVEEQSGGERLRNDVVGDAGFMGIVNARVEVLSRCAADRSRRKTQASNQTLAFLVGLPSK